MSKELRGALHNLLLIQDQLIARMRDEDPERLSLAGWRALQGRMAEARVALQADLDSATATQGRRADPSTSDQAVDLAVVRAGTHKYLLAEVYFNHSAGLTAEEAVHAAGLSERSSPWHRVSDLKQSGLLVYTGEVRPTRSGADAEVLAMTDEARATWRARHPGAFPTNPNYVQENIHYV